MFFKELHKADVHGAFTANRFGRCVMSKTEQVEED